MYYINGDKLVGDDRFAMTYLTINVLYKHTALNFHTCRSMTYLTINVLYKQLP